MINEEIYQKILNDYWGVWKALADLETYQTMLASEDVLRRDWDTPEEDVAWADLGGDAE